MTLTYSAPNTPRSTEIPTMFIRPSTLNPRKTFDEAALRELAASITEHGLLEPIVVREWVSPNIGGSAFEIVAGERRWRAARIAGLETVPVRSLGQIDDATALRLALVENLQRQDLDPIEEAEGYAALNRVVGLTQTEIGAAVHRSQPVIANRMRLLALPEDVREKIRAGELSPSHGVALAKWARFPALARALADDAVANNVPSKELEGDVFLGRTYWLKSVGVGEVINSREIHADGCTSCPFDAYVPGRFNAVCLNPEHYAELKAARMAEIESSSKATANDAGAEQSGLPRLCDLHYDSYRECQGRSTPAGCDEACPCRGRAIGYNGQPVEICLDPKRFAKLEAAATREKNKARRADAKDLMAKLRAVIDATEDVGAAEIVILAKQAASNAVGWALISPAWRDARKRLKIEVGGGTEITSVAAIARTNGPLVAVKLAVEAILMAELNSYHDAGGNPTLTRWYLDAKADPHRLDPRVTEVSR